MVDDFEDHANIDLEGWWLVARRRRWLIVLSMFISWALVWIVSYMISPNYESEALILVEQQKVPEQYVMPNVAIDEVRVQSITQQILSRTRLQSAIDRFHLYPHNHGIKHFFESGDPVERMRKDIKVELVQEETPGHSRQVTAFKIRYAAVSPMIAQRVNSELTSLFINENLRSQQQLSENTTAFLNNQLAEARVKLEAQEAKVRAYKGKHVGDLPSQLQSNVQILSGLQGQLETTQHALDAARQQKLYLESIQQQYHAVQTSLGTGDSSITSPAALSKEITEMRLRLADAQSRYSDDHPDIIALKEKITSTESLKKQIQDEIASKPKPDQADDSNLGGTQQMQVGSPTTMMQIRSQLKSNLLEIQNYEKRERDLETQISAYQARLNLTPETEQDLSDISRGYEESKSNYDSLLKKQNQSQLATSLQERQQGEQFTMIDPPSLPDKPASPNHLLMSLGGLVFGIAVAIVLTIFLELTNARVRHERDLNWLLPASVMVDIPHLSVPGEEGHRVRLRRMEIAVGIVISLLIMAGNLYAYYRG